MFNPNILAILRGITTDEILPVGEALYRAGWRCLEVPLNSPDAIKSIAMLQKEFGHDCMIGAGTVLTTDEVKQVADTGAKLIVSPCLNQKVVEETKKQNMISVPGVFTPTEAFSALDFGADALKIFPGEMVNPNYIKALRAVLPKGTVIFVTGGVNAGNMKEFLSSGVNGFGFGGALYKPNKPLADIQKDGEEIIEQFRSLV